MAQVAMIHDVTFIVKECGNCGVIYGLTRAFYEGHKRSGATWSCPNGHEWHVTKTREMELQEQIDAEKRRADFERTRRESAEHAERATRGQLTKLKNRIDKGVCLHCQRTFSNVARHMQTKHADHA